MEQPNTKNILPIVLAAGRGTRMKSTLPKVLHQVAGRSMLELVLTTLQQSFGSRGCVVLNRQVHAAASEHLEAFPEWTLVEQFKQKGTGDAVGCAAKAIHGAELPDFCQAQLLRGLPVDAEAVVVCNADCPALDGQTLDRLVAHATRHDSDLTVLGMQMDEPFGYGRLIQDEHGALLRIVEEKDADAKEKSVKICNSGVFYGKAKVVFELLSAIEANNAQGEYYVTDIFGLAVGRGYKVDCAVAQDAFPLLGVNDPWQLATTEHKMVQKHLEQQVKEHGLRVTHPDSIHVDLTVSFQGPARIGQGARILGKSTIGQGVSIGDYAVLDTVQVLDRACIGAHAVMRQVSALPGEHVPALSLRERQILGREPGFSPAP